MALLAGIWETENVIAIVSPWLAVCCRVLGLSKTSELDLPLNIVCERSQKPALIIFRVAEVPRLSFQFYYLDISANLCIPLIDSFRLTVDALTAPAVPTRNSRLKKKIDVSGQALIQLLDPRESYRILDHGGQLVRMADSRYAAVLVIRRLIGGVINGKGELVNLTLMPTKTAAQVRNVLKLKPPAQSICNKATVVEVGPENYWHRDLMGMLGKRL